jgi:uncharacterized membrane protein
MKFFFLQSLVQKKAAWQYNFYDRLKRGKTHPGVFILCVLILFYFGLILSCLYRRYIYLDIKEPTDSAACIQISWSVLKGTPFTVTIQEHVMPIYAPYNTLRAGLNFTLMLFSPVFLFTSSGIAFLIIQALIVSLAAVPLYLFSRRKLKNEWLALLITTAYLFNPATYTSFERFGFRLETLFILAFFAMFFFLEQDKFWSAAISLLIALLTKHNIIMIAFMLGLYYLVIERKRRRFGIFCLVLAVAYYVIGIRLFFFKLQLNDTESFKHFAVFGKTHSEALVNMVLHPEKIIAAVSQPEWKNMYHIFFPTGFLALLHPVFWVSLPQLVMNAVISNYRSIICGWHWAAVVPFMFVGIVYTMEWILGRFNRNSFLQYIFFSILIVGLYYNLADFNRAVLRADKNFFYKKNNIDTRKIIDRLSIIEPDAPVMVSGQLLWFFAARDHVYTARIKFHDEVKYIVYMLTGYPSIDRYMRKELSDPDSKYHKKFKVISETPDLVIYKNIKYTS